ncbi:hypothetical protein IL306_015178 [Fusarium sp. DS 682]|nr:hypothetical protein IL306_015178 [Fusarium sp. DS 682]
MANYLGLFNLARSLFSDLNPGRVRIRTPELGVAFALKSQQLEHLSVAFMIDVRHFFKACQPDWHWPKLQSLTLTSWSMSKANAHKTNEILRDAAQFALNMPELKTLTLWYGARGQASAFTYCRKDTTIYWRGTRDLKLESETIKAWEMVAEKYVGRVLGVQKELLVEEITSHGDAIHNLGLHHVIDRVSLQQIRAENRISWLP